MTEEQEYENQCLISRPNEIRRVRFFGPTKTIQVFATLFETLTLKH